MNEMWANIIRMIRQRIDRITGMPADLTALADMARPLLIVLAVTLVSFLGVDILYKAVSLQVGYHPIAGKSRQADAALPGMTGQPAERYQIITERNLFQTTLQAIADKNAGGNVLPSEEYTAFDLKGTIAVDQSVGFAIVEEKGKGKQKLYRIGEMIGSAKLVRITRNTAVLKGGEQEYVMKIKDTAEGAPAGRSGRGPGSGIAISRQEVTQSLGDLKSIMSQAVVRPFFSGGVQQGFVISNIAPGSLYQKLGLVNGDIVLDVNQKKLESADDILQLVNVMQAGGSISVNLMRNGQKETINYSFH
ncbi:MAG: PDZ domain-containing protein [Deltaproteobacteria bacterium]